jgi:D-alanyl-D-alanine carboxypeptidase (penicillin-binding protein 5/6)
LVLGALPGADGLKTGHTDASGYGITISAKRDNQRLILVLNGLRYPQYHNDYFPNIKRAEEAGRVMDMAFREFRSYPVLTTNQVIGNIMVTGGNMPDVPVTAANAVNVTMQVDSHAGMKTALRADPGLAAPIHVGQKVGVLVISAPDFPGMNVPVYATQSVNKQGFLASAFESVSHLWKKK